MTLPSERPTVCDKCDKVLDNRDKMKRFQIIVCEHCHHVMEYKTTSTSKRKQSKTDVMLNISKMSKEDAVELMQLLEGKL